MNQEPYFINNPSNSLAPSLTTGIFEESDAMEFHRGLEIYKPTPLVELKSLAKEMGVGKIYLKDESFRFGLNAFKGLGASYAIHKILEKDPSVEIFCTATDGNHGRAVAWSAKIFGKESRIYVPRNTARSRIEAIEGEGAVVEEINGTYEETCAYAQIMSEGNGWKLVQDAANIDYEEIPAHIMAGYFTHFKELEDTLHVLPQAKVDLVFLQCGVGSWPASAAWYYVNRYGKNKPKLVAVEPVEAAGLLASFNAGERISPKGKLKTIMAGLNCGIPSTSAWDILKNTVDATMAIPDSFTIKAIRRLYYSKGDDPRIISGESGAGGIAGFIALMTDPQFEGLKNSLKIDSSSRILFYSTEGATDPGNYQLILEEFR